MGVFHDFRGKFFPLCNVWQIGHDNVKEHVPPVFPFFSLRSRIGILRIRIRFFLGNVGEQIRLDGGDSGSQPHGIFQGQIQSLRGNVRQHDFPGALLEFQRQRDADNAGARAHVQDAYRMVRDFL